MAMNQFAILMLPSTDNRRSAFSVLENMLDFMLRYGNQGESLRHPLTGRHYDDESQEWALPFEAVT
jgi:hypothetical protein